MIPAAVVLLAICTIRGLVLLMEACESQSSATKTHRCYGRRDVLKRLLHPEHIAGSFYAFTE